MRTICVRRGAPVGMLAMVIWMVAGGSQAMAQSDVIYPLPIFSPGMSLGMVGLAAGQTARLNVLNPGPQPGPQRACSVQLQFFDAQGQMVKQTTVDNLAPGKATSYDLQLNEVQTPAGANRAQIRAVVRSLPAAPSPQADTTMPIAQYFACSVTPTLEVFDQATGKTTVILENARTLPIIVPLPLTGGATAPPAADNPQ